MVNIQIKKLKKLNPIFISSNDITYVQGNKDYVYINTNNGDRHIKHSTMKNMESLLGEDFIRVHKSFIVNKSYIDYRHEKAMVVDGKEIPVGGKYQRLITE